MMNFIRPTIGLILGILIIIFRKKICVYIEKLYNNFPIYKDGVKALNISFTVRPLFILVIGLLIIMFSLVSILSI